jgi:23S rRNA (cytosine1962-C5)-methyltransferase
MAARPETDHSKRHETKKMTDEIVVRRVAARAIERGHPWIFRDAIAKAPPRVKRGEVRLKSDDGAAIGVGIYDPESAIAVRVWSTDPHAGVAKLLHERLGRCLHDRARLFDDEETTAYRLAHGEGDRVPGIVIDRYADVAVVRPDGPAASELVRAHADTICELVSARGITRIVLRERDQEACMLHGSKIEAPLTVKEHGVPFVVDVMRGQKTGAFLDQRENRRRVGEIVRGLRRSDARGRNGAREARVLNLFSYAGGFSLHAARAGAVTTSVDVAAAAHKTAMDSFREAGVDPKKHSFVTADAFVFLDRAAGEKKTWDVVVSDPPSFAPNARSLERALSAYRKLHRACAKVLAKDGVFCAASCSSHVDHDAFAGTLDDHALGRADLSVTETFGPPADHPTLAAWPEGRYLKFFVLR